MIILRNNIFLSLIVWALSLLSLKAQSVGGVISGGTVYCDTNNTGFLSLTSYNGTIQTWESSTDSIVWSSTSNNIAQQSYYHLKQSTWYRAIVQDGALAPDTSAIAKITIYPTSVGGTVSGGGYYCGGTGSGALSLTGYVGSILNWQYSTDNGSSWTSVAVTTDSLYYSDFNEDRIYEAVLQTNVVCPVDTSTQVSFTYSPSVGGFLSGGGDYCDSSGVGTLNLTGNIGSVLYWQYSIDSGASWTQISHLPNLMNHPNITQNTLYEVVVQLGSCVPDSSSQVVFSFTPSIAGMLSGTDSVCAGTNNGSVSLSGNQGDVLYWMYSSNGGASWNTLLQDTTSINYTDLTATTRYKAVVKNGSCKNDTSDYVEVFVHPLPNVDAGNDTIINKKESMILNGSGEGSPTWSPDMNIDSIDVFTPTVSPEEALFYYLTVLDSNMCENSDSVFVDIMIPTFTGKISSYFTPNGDGVNDTFFVENIENTPGNSVSIYNIYGVLVYEQKNYMNDWEGTYNGAVLPDGTYFYVLQFDNSNEVYKGALDILKNK